MPLSTLGPGRCRPRLRGLAQHAFCSYDSCRALHSAAWLQRNEAGSSLSSVLVLSGLEVERTLYREGRRERCWRKPALCGAVWSIWSAW